MGAQIISKCTSPCPGPSERHLGVQEPEVGAWTDRYKPVARVSLPLQRTAHSRPRDLGHRQWVAEEGREPLRNKILKGDYNAICIWNLPENKLSNLCPSMKIRSNIHSRSASELAHFIPRTLPNYATVTGDDSDRFKI